MGYLSQRKRQERIDVSMKFLLALAAVISFMGFIPFVLGDFVTGYRLQTGIVLFAMIFFSLFHRLYLYAGLSMLLIILNFFVISSAGNIFFTESATPKKQITVAYGQQPNVEEAGIIISMGIGIFSEYPVATSGTIKLTPDNRANFASFEIDGSEYMFIGADLGNLKNNEIEKALNALKTFIDTRDEPVILIGDFNAVAWSTSMNRFLNNTGFYVINPIVSSLTDFVIPSHFYIISYKNLYFYQQKKLINDGRLIKIGI